MIIDYNDEKSAIDKTCYISESVDIIGEVIIEENGNIYKVILLWEDQLKL